MRRIRSKDSAPEMTVRRLVHRMGFRYRLHNHKLPGRPDLVFPARRKIVLVHGCYWHAHERCRIAHVPKSNRRYWRPKLERNRQRDAENLVKLRTLGWRVLTVWECEIKNSRRVEDRLRRFLLH
jgi:DNA mismatch endonuclease (patch repair protein)